jgi:hypothetical protein
MDFRPICRFQRRLRRLGLVESDKSSLDRRIRYLVPRLLGVARTSSSGYLSDPLALASLLGILVGFDETKTAEATLEAANWAKVHARGGEIPAILEK